MTGDPPSPARLPTAAPSKADLEEWDRWATLVAGSRDTVRGSARTWRTGLTAFITLVTTGVIIRGPTTTVRLPVAWRVLTTVLIGGGLLLAAVGLWQALAAEAGSDPRMLTLQDVRSAYDTLVGYEVHLAAQAARRLQWGRRAVAVAVLLFLAGITVTWWAPTAPSPPTCIFVTHGNAVVCGTLDSDGASYRNRRAPCLCWPDHSRRLRNATPVAGLLRMYEVSDDGGLSAEGRARREKPRLQAA